MLIDTHSHLNFKAFDIDYKKVIDKCLFQDVWMINIGSQYQTSKKAIQIAQQYEQGVFAAIGLHPIHAKDGFNKEEYEKLLGSEKIVAIGEIGLDKFRDYGLFLEEQKKVFLEQLDFAKEMNLPVIIHCRMAHQEVLDILKKREAQGVIHCFTGSWKQAKQYLAMGFYLGINGIIYKLNLEEIIEKAPLNRILLETDCPYLGKEERNEPTFVKQIAKDIARIKNISFQEVAETTTQNAQTLFSI